MNKFLDAEKTLEVLLYISHRTDNLFNIVKTLYFADKFHLEEYGQLLTGDYYVPMREGPVPSGAYDLIKLARGDDFLFDKNIIDVHPEEAFKVIKCEEGYNIRPNREPNLDLLSESNIHCLNKSINLYGNMSIRDLWRIAHKEESYNKYKGEREIPLREIILLDVSDGKDVLEYLDS